MRKNQEIERKWKLPAVPEWIRKAPYTKVLCVFVEQAYLVAEPELEIRLRRWGDRYSMTKKRGNGLVREEKEVPIGKDLFCNTVGLLEGRVVKKHRFIAQVGACRLEIDDYQDDLAGLVILEVEFETEEEAQQFVLPSNCGFEEAEEVTGRPEFSNKNLALSVPV